MIVGCFAGFIISRCSDATMAFDTAVDRRGHVTVGWRRFAFVGAVMVFGGGAYDHAYTNLSTGDIHLCGNIPMNGGWMCGNMWIHEICFFRRSYVTFYLTRSGAGRPRVQLHGSDLPAVQLCWLDEFAYG
jgi:hypothetical protein